MTQIKAETLSEATTVVVGLGLSFAAGKWLFGEDVGNLLRGWAQISQGVVCALALLLPTFQTMTLVEKVTQKPYATTVWGAVAAIISFLILIIGISIGASIDAKKHLDLADATARAQRESQRQYERLSEAFLVSTNGCRAPEARVE